MSDLAWFILIFVFLWLVWFATGGPARYENKMKPFVEEPYEDGIGEGIY